MTRPTASAADSTVPDAEPQHPLHVTNELFRIAFRHHPAGVAIVTAANPDPVGITASSVASVSADPPALSFSVSGGRSAGRVAEADTVVVHLMDAAHVDTVTAYATTGTERFAEGTWEPAVTGEPVLKDAPWALRCKVIERVPVGSSILVAAEVLEILRGEHSEPLVYHNRAFHRLTEASLIQSRDAG